MMEQERPANRGRHARSLRTVKIPVAFNAIARTGRAVRIMRSPCGLFPDSSPHPASQELGIHDSYITRLKNKLLTTVS
jgi:hypothetical protein